MDTREEILEAMSDLDGTPCFRGPEGEYQTAGTICTLKGDTAHASRAHELAPTNGLS